MRALLRNQWPALIVLAGSLLIVGIACAARDSAEASLANTQQRLIAVADLRRQNDDMIVIVVRDTKYGREYMVVCGTREGHGSGNGCGVAAMNNISTGYD